MALLDQYIKLKWDLNLDMHMEGELNQSDLGRGTKPSLNLICRVVKSLSHCYRFTLRSCTRIKKSSNMLKFCDVIFLIKYKSHIYLQKKVDIYIYIYII